MITFQKTVLLILITLSLGLQSEAVYSADLKKPQEHVPAKGYNCLFMGHSFFWPAAYGMQEHAKRAGFTAHKQQVFCSGDLGGSAGMLWTNEKDRASIQAAIKTGDVDLIGMTYHTMGGSALSDYKRWVDFALKYNPKTKFFIGMPWQPYPVERKLEEYKAGYDTHHKVVHGIFDALRKEHPGNVFFCIPYGQGSVELKKLFEAGKLPQVKALQTNKEKKVTGIYSDLVGHADEKDGMLIDLIRLVWLATIYEVDLSKYDWDPGHCVDLRPIAAKIAAGDPYASLAATAQVKWENLFDNSLSKWENPYEWGKAEYVDGIVNLTTEKSKWFLLTKREYADFVFEGEIKMPVNKGNSGFLFRCQKKKNLAWGYQAEVDTSSVRKWSGGLYDEGRRAWFISPNRDHAASEAEKQKSIDEFRARAGDCYKEGQWNKYRIVCNGSHIQISVNGVVTTDVHDEMDIKGYIGIQHHGEKGLIYQFRNLRIQDLGEGGGMKPIQRRDQ